MNGKHILNTRYRILLEKENINGRRTEGKIHITEEQNGGKYM